VGCCCRSSLRRGKGSVKGGIVLVAQEKEALVLGWLLLLLVPWEERLAIGLLRVVV
jgi:hypothetical protein